MRQLTPPCREESETRTRISSLFLFSWRNHEYLGHRNEHRHLSKSPPARDTSFSNPMATVPLPPPYDLEQHRANRILHSRPNPRHPHFHRPHRVPPCPRVHLAHPEAVVASESAMDKHPDVKESRSTPSSGTSARIIGRKTAVLPVGGVYACPCCGIRCLRLRCAECWRWRVGCRLLGNWRVSVFEEPK